MSAGASPLVGHPKRTCPDCPAARNGRLSALVGDANAACVLQCQPVEARSALPSAWSERNAFAIVRRGWVMRSRVDGRGNHTAVDLAGPGALVMLRGAGEGSVPSGFAATRALLCLCPDGSFDEATASPALAFDLVRLHQETLERVERIADARGRETAAEKVAALLGVLSAFRGAKGGTRELPDGLQQRDLAALLQLRPETVCRAMRLMESDDSAERRHDDELTAPAPR